MKERISTYLLSLLIVALFSINTSVFAQEKFENPVLRPVIENLVNFHLKGSYVFNPNVIYTNGLSEIINGNELNQVLEDIFSDPIIRPEINNLEQRGDTVEDRNRDIKSSINQVISSTNDRSDLGSRINIYPNPTSSFVNIATYGGLEQLNVSLYNIAGQLVFTEQYQALDRISFPVSQYPVGIYMLTVSSEKQHYTHKVHIK